MSAGSFIWYELMTPDPDAATRFYGAVVGWKISAAAPMPDGKDYRGIQRSDGGAAGGVLKLSADNGPAEVKFQFKMPLEDASIHWMCWRNGWGRIAMPSTSCCTMRGANCGRISKRRACP
jgi:predicted enzyme related to lactoylglutathione lyase